MKILVILIAAVAVGIGSAQASLSDPGAPVPAGNGYIYTLYDDSLGGALPVNVTENQVLFRHFLTEAVIPGDLVLLESVNGGAGYNNWSDVVDFYNVADAGGVLHGIADVYSWDDFSHFGSLQTLNKFIYEAAAGQGENSQGGAYTIYVADDPGAPANTYYIESVVPEPSTYIAGALLLLPFGASTVRRLRKSSAA
jgi:hypothetical protein